MCVGAKPLTRCLSRTDDVPKFGTRTPVTVCRRCAAGWPKLDIRAPVATPIDGTTGVPKCTGNNDDALQIWPTGDGGSIENAIGAPIVVDARPVAAPVCVHENLMSGPSDAASHFW